MRERQNGRPGKVGAPNFEQQQKEDFATLTQLLCFVCTESEAEHLAASLLAELRTLPRAVAADFDTYARLGIKPRAIEILRVFQRAMEASLRRGLEHAPILPGHSALIDYLHVAHAWRQREAFRVLFLNSTNLLIADEVMATGTVNAASVHVREVIKRALDLHATSIILVHNHPSGEPKPSTDDIMITHQVRDACRTIGILLHDHIIIGSRGHTSFKALGKL